MDDKIIFNMHIMWYESKMIVETLDSIKNALQHSTVPVEFYFCLNSQTYLEKPETGRSEEMFTEFLKHPIIQRSNIIHKTDRDSFYNIGDWRREQYDVDAKYTVWGESDCILPEDFFYILSTISIPETHILTFASRKMWDTTWDIVEHIDLQKYTRSLDQIYQAPTPLNSCDVISEEEINNYNSKFAIEIIKLNTVKIDGSLLCISKGVKQQLIPTDMHFVREDFCAEQVLKAIGVPQYHVATRIKGHNYSHPAKRTNTRNTRNDSVFKEYAEQSQNAMNQFLYSL
jgi:hypothetical protein